MKIFKSTGLICLTNLLLISCHYNAEDISTVNKQNEITIENLANRKVKKINGLTKSGEFIFNKDLSCRLKSWELLGVFNNNQLVTTQGEFVFEITNHNFKNQTWVIFELLILDKEENVLTTSNPFRKIQGEILKISPPLEQGKSTLLRRGWKYRDGWDKVTLKSCQWANSPDDYWEKYPELKDYLAP